MALRQNTGLRNSLADAFGDLFGGGTMQIRTGAQPASANDAASGTLLATITLPATPFSAANAGSIGKNGTWSTTAAASGTAGWARIEADATGEVFDILVTESGGGGEAIINNASVIEGGDVTVNTFNYTVPSGE